MLVCGANTLDRPKISTCESWEAELYVQWTPDDARVYGFLAGVSSSFPSAAYMGSFRR